MLTASPTPALPNAELFTVLCEDPVSCDNIFEDAPASSERERRKCFQSVSALLMVIDRGWGLEGGKLRKEMKMFTPPVHAILLDIRYALMQKLMIFSIA